jgi:hypothetical protein
MPNKTKDKKTDLPELITEAEDQAERDNKPHYRNWDFPTFMKKNPNATEKEIREFLRERSNLRKLGF